MKFLNVLHVKNILFLQKNYHHIFLEIFVIHAAVNIYILYMTPDNNFYMCILCENICLIPIQIINFINNYNKDKDIYFENIETKEVDFYNVCKNCYDSDNILNDDEIILKKHVVSLP